MSGLDATMDTLARRFLVRCAEDVPKLQRYLASPTQETDDLRLIVHRMAGSAGLFGYSAIGALAARVDDELSSARAVEVTTLPTLVEALQKLLVA